ALLDSVLRCVHGGFSAGPLELLCSEEVSAGTQIHGAPNARKQSLQAAKSANSGHGGKIIQNPHSHRTSLNGDEMSCIGTIFLTCLDLLTEYITTEK
ncbi:hypothetical protein ACJX0J_040774, partial [Zea mays]